VRPRSSVPVLHATVHSRPVRVSGSGAPVHRDSPHGVPRARETTAQRHPAPREGDDRYVVAAATLCRQAGVRGRIHAPAQFVELRRRRSRDAGDAAGAHLAPGALVCVGRVRPALPRLRGSRGERGREQHQRAGRRREHARRQGQPHRRDAAQVRRRQRALGVGQEAAPHGAARTTCPPPRSRSAGGCRARGCALPRAMRIAGRGAAARPVPLPRPQFPRRAAAAASAAARARRPAAAWRGRRAGGPAQPPAPPPGPWSPPARAAPGPTPRARPPPAARRGPRQSARERMRADGRWRSLGDPAAVCDEGLQECERQRKCEQPAPERDAASGALPRHLSGGDGCG
jgi:hypothetical protein